MTQDARPTVLGANRPLKQLATSYPSLVAVSGTQKSLRVNFFNRTETTSEMLKLAEGSSGMKFIALGYGRLMKRYACPGKLHPVIMLVDNDEGGREVILPFKKTAKKINASTHYITENLYVVQIPKLASKDTTLEDYFESTVLNETINGKTFNRNNKFDNQHHYGKSIFAKSVIQKKQATINFESFKAILDLIEAVIADYKNITSQPNAETQSTS